jgi:hypothetical protein
MSDRENRKLLFCRRWGSLAEVAALGPIPAVCRASVWWPLQRHCGDLDGRFEMAAFPVLLAA